MGIRRGPNIIQSGLVLSLDAGNVRSYPGSGTTWFDVSSRRAVAALGNGPGYTTQGRGAIDFDGTNDFADAPAITGTLTDWTVCIWFYPTSVSNYENPIDCNYGHPNGSGNVGPRLEMDNSGNLTWIWSGDSGNGNFYISTAVASGLAQSTWHFAALSRTSSNTVLNFLDGEIKTTNVSVIGSPSATFVNEFTNVNLGRGFSLGGTERYYSGFISSAFIYNRALSASEILQNFNMTKTRFGL